MCTSLLESKMSEKLERQAVKGEAGWVDSLCKLVTTFDQQKEEKSKVGLDLSKEVVTEE